MEDTANVRLMTLSDDRLALLARAAILPLLPDRFHPERGDKIPEHLVGATILRIGTATDIDVEDGGLIVDYVPAYHRDDWDCVFRVIFGFNELGMWVEGHSKLTSQDFPQE